MLGSLPLLAALTWGRQPGLIARVSSARGVRMWGPGTDPTACALVSWRCALWRWQEGIPVEGASCLRGGRLGLGVHSPPIARPCGRQLGSAAHMLWLQVCRPGGPAVALCLACPARHCAPRGCREVAPGRGHLSLFSGASRVRRSPSPGCPSLGQVAEPVGCPPPPPAHKKQDPKSGGLRGSNRKTLWGIFSSPKMTMLENVEHCIVYLGLR